MKIENSSLHFHSKIVYAGKKVGTYLLFQVLDRNGNEIMSRKILSRWPEDILRLAREAIEKVGFEETTDCFVPESVFKTRLQLEALLKNNQLEIRYD